MNSRQVEQQPNLANSKMNLSLEESLTTAMRSDLDIENDFPAKRPLLAHYTSVSTLEKIVTTNQLWLSHPLYMNDIEELRFGMNVGAENFRSSRHLAEVCVSSKRHAFLIGKFDEFFSNFDNNHVLDTYVLCLSEHTSGNNDGLLSMWRGYGANGGGVAIVFDTANLKQNEESPFILGRVRYQSHPERLKWIDSKLCQLAQVLATTELTEDNLSLAAHVFIERLKLFALFTKHDGFSEEREWRIVYMNERDPQQLMRPMFGYAITGQGVEPKLKFEFSKVAQVLGSGVSLESLVDLIILGPSISSVLSENSVRRMLDVARQGDLALRVTASSIPYRATTSGAS
jgi:hypothetical protein